MRQQFLLGTLLAVIMASGSLAQPASLENAALASWKHHGDQYTATIKGGSFILLRDGAGTGRWLEVGVAMSDVSCVFLAQIPSDPDTLRFELVTREDMIMSPNGPTVPKRVWTRDSADSAPDYSDTRLIVPMDLAAKDTTWALLAGKLDQALAGGPSIPTCKL